MIKNANFRYMEPKEYFINQDSQHMKANYFCVTCRGIGSRIFHYPNCTNKEVYAIPSSAEVPRKNASKKKWKDFLENCVYIRPVGYWQHFSRSWFCLKMTKPNLTFYKKNN